MNHTPHLTTSQSAATEVSSASPVPLDCTAVLTHHWLIRERGGEKVLRAFRELLPHAPIYTLVHDPAHLDDDWGTIHVPKFSRAAIVRRHYQKMLPLLPALARSVRLPDVDLVLCSDAAIAKAMRPHPRSKVVCYCHSPMRYVWDLEAEYRRTLPPPARPLWGPICRRVRRADFNAAQRVDLMVANSRHVAERIRRNYNKSSVVVHPPVEVPPSAPTGERQDYYLAVGYHVPYKRLDIAVEACRLLDRKLVVIGEGPDVKKIDPRRDTHVELRGWCRANEISKALAEARGLLFPGEEDFGIVPVEAIGHGCPVIAYGVGGATESIIDGQTGVHFHEQTAAALVNAIRRFEGMQFDPFVLNAAAQRFGKSRFLTEMREVCTAALEERLPKLDIH
ncbi:MAG: glycosyltransferase [Phycisphaerae bacterium]